MKNRYKFWSILPTLMLLFLLVLFAAPARAATATLLQLDGQQLSGDMSPYASVNVAGESITGAENIGLYHTYQGVWLVCLSPAGLVDYAPHTYDRLLSTDQTLAALNSPPWRSGGLANAAGILQKFEPEVLASGDTVKGWALTAAVYTSLYQDATVSFTPLGISSGLKADYQTYLAGAFPAEGVVFRPAPLSGQGLAGQQFLHAVPEPATASVGFIMIGSLLFLPRRKNQQLVFGR